jgi:hypothetical protein
VPASLGPPKLLVAPPADISLSGNGGTDATDNGDVPADAAWSAAWDSTLPGQAD